MEMEIVFGGGMKVDAEFNGFTVKTDQAVDSGGQGSAPEPFAYYLASLGTCAALYIQGFCEVRKIPTDGLRLTQTAIWQEEPRRLAEVRLKIHLPQGFPEKYHKAVTRAAGTCAVKKSILDPPEFIFEVAE